MRRARRIAAACVAAVAGLALPSLSAAQILDQDPRVVRVLDEISAERLRGIVERLAAFQTRHTLSSPDTPEKGVGAAREWIRQEMQGYSPRLQVGFDTYRIPAQGRITREAELRNVMAVLPGRSARWLYVSGHYDTVARDATGSFAWDQNLDRPAPGANDDGSGTALTMELARVIAQSGIEFEPTLVFLALAGEEEGLVGARLHAQKARAEETRIDAVLNNDIVGNVYGGDGVVDGGSVRVFSEDPMDSPSRQLARYIRRQAARYLPGHEVRLIAREDRFGRGGDHTAFNQLGYPGVRISESKENYARQHTVEDTPEGVDAPYLAKNARVNGAALASLALAPEAPDVADAEGNPTLGRGESGYDAHLRWQRSPGAVAYRIVWREAWTPDWQHELVVGDVSEHLLTGVSIDDFIFGVAAIGPEGNESLTSAFVRLPRAAVEIRTVR